MRQLANLAVVAAITALIAAVTVAAVLTFYGTAHAEPAFAEKHEPVKAEEQGPKQPTAEDQLAQCRAMLEEIAPLARARAAQLFPTKEPAR